MLTTEGFVSSGVVQHEEPRRAVPPFGQQTLGALNPSHLEAELVSVLIVGCPPLKSAGLSGPSDGC